MPQGASPRSVGDEGYVVKAAHGFCVRVHGRVCSCTRACVRVRTCLRACSGNLAHAMEWLLEHSDDPNVDDPLPPHILQQLARLNAAFVPNPEVRMCATSYLAAACFVVLSLVHPLAGC